MSQSVGNQVKEKVMAFGIKANNVKSILSYNAAVQHFEQTPVPRTRSAKIW